MVSLFPEIRSSPFGFLAPSSLFAALVRLLNGVTIAFRPRLPMFPMTILGTSWLDNFHLPGRQGFVLRSVTRLLRP